MTQTETVTDELAIQDRVLVEADVSGRPVPFRAVIVRICPTELWLGLMSPDRRLETVSPSEPVRLTVAREGAALLGDSVLLRPLGGSKSRVFAVARPQIMEKVQRRGHVRYPIDLPIHVRQIDPVTWEPRGKAVTTVTRNLSPGGMLFVSDFGIDLGDDLDLALPLSGGDRVSMNGVVKRLGQAADGGRSMGGRQDRLEVAVKFTRISTLDQDRIVRLILLAEHRRREAALHERYWLEDESGRAERPVH
jgi:c-di-GMP-binding flagellar brake protein YcgR